MKKIIALVLFAAMLFAMVPVASAAGDNFKVAIPDAKTWWAEQQPQSVADVDADDPTQIAVNGKISVKVTKEEQTIDQDSTASKTITVNLSGSYSGAQAHSYVPTGSSLVQAGNQQKYVRIPYTVDAFDGANAELAAALAYISSSDDSDLPYGGISLDLREEIYYLSFVLSADDRTDTYYINATPNMLYPVIIKVVWDNTDNNAAPSAAGPHPSLKVVGYDSSAAQYGNFTVDFKDMSKGAKGRMTFNIAAYTMADRSTIWDASYGQVATSAAFRYNTSFGWWNPDTINDWTFTRLINYIEDLMNSNNSFMTGISLDRRFNTGTFSNPVWVYRSKVTQAVWTSTVAGKWSDVQNVIVIAGEEYAFFADDDTMDVRLKAFDPAAVAYPAGTIVSVGKVQKNTDSSASLVKYSYVDSDNVTVWGWDQYLGKSSKYINVYSEPTYLIDNQNSFVFSIDGITSFALAAGYYKDAYGNVDSSASGAYSDEDIVLLYQNQYKLFELIFNSGKNVDVVQFDIFFKNISRTKSGITIIGDREITVEVGSSLALPYVLDDAYAMSKDLTENWETSNKKIVEFTNAKTGAFKATGVGTAYVYAKDATGTFQIFIINVVDAAAVVPEAPATAYKTYVVTASNLYVRSGPGTNYKSLGKLPRGTEVAGIEVDGSVWVQVNYNGTTAYMSGKYLAEK
ncbi:MAG: SH3 domain-containing protein [Christensenellales bacterium]|jgi:hypothetical protein